MRGILAARAERGRSVWVVDSFAGLPPPTGEHETFDLSAEHFPQLAVARERVAENFERFGLLDGRVRFLEGWFKETLPDGRRVTPPAPPLAARAGPPDGHRTRLRGLHVAAAMRSVPT